MISIRNSCLALFAVSSLFFANSAYAEEEAGEFACNSQDLLGITLEQGMPVVNDQFVDGCTFLPAGYQPREVRDIGIVGAYCGVRDEKEIECPVKVVEAVDEGRLYYIAYGWLDGVSMFEPDLVADLYEDGTLIPTAVPCRVQNVVCDVYDSNTVMTAKIITKKEYVQDRLIEIYFDQMNPVQVAGP